ncbi:MAG TPA: serine hydrolase [Candidatus Bathyarchaeia archaeon]|nr:serine hydrolase [Candidatus Bathyarchaeia archaeon]
MAPIKDFPRKRLDLKNPNNIKKYKGTRLGIVVLFFGTIVLSFLLWFKNQAKDLWQKVTAPSVYRISKSNEQELEDVLGIKPNLTGFEGVKKSTELLVQGLQGEYGVYFYQLKQNEFFGINEDQVFTAASVNKVPIIVSFYQKVDEAKLSENEIYTLKKEDVQDYGTGSMRYDEAGTVYSYLKLVELSGKESDNTAALVLLNLLGGDIEQHFKTLKMKNTSLEENTTTPKEMGDYWVKLYNFELISSKSTEKVLDVLTNTQFEDRISKGVPEYIDVSHKIGNEIQVVNDCGIILSNNPYVLCVLTRGVFEEEAIKVIPKISRLIWEFAKK